MDKSVSNTNYTEGKWKSVLFVNNKLRPDIKKAFDCILPYIQSEDKIYRPVASFQLQHDSKIEYMIMCDIIEKENTSDILYGQMIIENDKGVYKLLQYDENTPYNVIDDFTVGLRDPQIGDIKYKAERRKP